MLGSLSGPPAAPSTPVMSQTGPRWPLRPLPVHPGRPFVCRAAFEFDFDTSLVSPNLGRPEGAWASGVFPATKGDERFP